MSAETSTGTGKTLVDVDRNLLTSQPTNEEVVGVECKNCHKSLQRKSLGVAERVSKHFQASNDGVPKKGKQL